MDTPTSSCMWPLMAAIDIWDPYFHSFMLWTKDFFRLKKNGSMFIGQLQTFVFILQLTHPYFPLARGFDFVLSFGMTITFITPVMSIKWIGKFWGVGIDMLKSMEFGNLVGHFSSSRQFFFFFFFCINNKFTNQQK